MILSATGSSKAPRNQWVHEWIRCQIRELRPEYVLSGGARGWDAAVAAAAYLERVPYELCLPSKDYGTYYWKDWPEGFRRMCAAARAIEYVRPSHIGTNGRPGGANFDRNVRLAERGDVFLVYDVGSPGTRHCVREIERRGKRMIKYPVEA